MGQERKLGLLSCLFYRYMKRQDSISPCLAVDVCDLCSLCVLTPRLEDPPPPLTCALDPHLSEGIVCQLWHSADAVDLGS